MARAISIVAGEAVCPEKWSVMEKDASSGSPASVRIIRSDGTVETSQALTAISARTAVSVASLLPVSKLLRQGRPLFSSASKTTDRKTHTRSTMETGKGRCRQARPPFAPTHTNLSTASVSPVSLPLRSYITARSSSPLSIAAFRSDEDAQTRESSTCG